MSLTDLRRVCFGILTPSSNTVLEPLTQQIVSQLPGVSVHFARFRVLQITLSRGALAQFDNRSILEAARLLADAKVDVIGWSGTSSGWLGFEADEHLCREIKATTGIPATTSVLGLNRIVKRLGIMDMSLLTPYTDEVQAAIVKNYSIFGVNCSREIHLGMFDNASFADITETELDIRVQDLVARGAMAISVFCTGLRAAHLVNEWEQKFGIIVLDTISTVLWDMCRIVKVDACRVTGWGRIFQYRTY